MGDGNWEKHERIYEEQIDCNKSAEKKLAAAIR